MQKGIPYDFSSVSVHLHFLEPLLSYLAGNQNMNLFHNSHQIVD